MIIGLSNEDSKFELLKIELQDDKLSFSQSIKDEDLYRCYVINEDLILTFHVNYLTLHKGNLKKTGKIDWDSLLNTRQASLCRHSIASAFDKE